MWGLKSRVQGSGIGVTGLELKFRVLDLGFWA